jgi:hypothetical protein
MQVLLMGWITMLGLVAGCYLLSQLALTLHMMKDAIHGPWPPPPVWHYSTALHMVEGGILWSGKLHLVLAAVAAYKTPTAQGEEGSGFALLFVGSLGYVMVLVLGAAAPTVALPLAKLLREVSLCLAL